MKNWQSKIFRIFGVSLALLCLIPTQVVAQQLSSDSKSEFFDIDQTAYDWAYERTSDQKILNVLAGGNDGTGKLDGNYIQCGTDTCNLEKNICWQYHWGGPNRLNYKCLPIGQPAPIGYDFEEAWKCVEHCTLKRGVLREKNETKKRLNYSNTFCSGKTDSTTGKEICYELVVDGDAITVVNSNNNNNGLDGCEILPIKINRARQCFFCPLIEVVYDASARMTQMSFDKLSAAFATLLFLGMAIWVAVQTLTHVSSLTKQDGPKFLGGLLKQSYKFLLAFMLLQYNPQIYTYIVNPVINTGIAFGQQLLPHDFAKQDVQSLHNDMERDAVNAGKNAGSEAAVQQPKQIGNKYLTKELYEHLDTYIKGIQKNLSVMQAIGTSLICAGWNGIDVFEKDSDIGFFDGFRMLGQGVAMAAFAFLLILAFTFYMLDAVVQLGIVGALAPFLVASWPFKLTSQYAGTGAKMMLNSAFVFMFVGLVVAVDIELVNSAVMGNATNSEELKKCQNDDPYYDNNTTACDEVIKNSMEGGLLGIAKAFNDNDIKALKQLTNISTMGFLGLIFCCIFGFKLTNQVSNLAGQFSGGGIQPIAPSVATMGASAALSGAKAITRPAREAVGRHASDLAVRTVTKPFRLLGQGYRALRGRRGSGSSGGSSGSGGSSTAPTPNPTPSSGASGVARVSQGTVRNAQNSAGGPAKNMAAKQKKNNQQNVNSRRQRRYKKPQ